MPLVLAGTIAYAAGLLTGFGGALVPGIVAVAALLALAAARGSLRLTSVGLVAAAGLLVAAAARRRDDRCLAAIAAASGWALDLEDEARPGAAVAATLRTGSCAVQALVLVREGRAPAGAVAAARGRLLPGRRGLALQDARLRDTGRRALLPSVRARARARIDALFGTDAGLARALLVADMRGIAGETRDRFAASGLVHVLSVSGLHVAVIAEAALVVLAALRLPASRARAGALAATAAYVVVLGCPPPALRAGVMLGVRDAARLAQRPTSPWAALALGALVPLLADPHAVTDVGWQLSVAGMAALLASGALAGRWLEPRVAGWRLTMARELLTGVVATAVTAPIVAATFGRVSVLGPLSNVAAAPIVAVLQPTLFLALLMPALPLARIAAAAAHPMLLALDGVARLGAAVPFASPAVQPTAATALLCAAASAALVVACASHFPARALVAGAGALALAAWRPVLPARGDGRVELHMIDVGQGDALALRTPAGRWILFDAGRIWRGGDAGRETVIPYLARRGGTVEAFVLSHPHADHVGGAASVLHALRPRLYRDAAFAGASPSYRASLTAADSLGVGWARVHPGDSLLVDGVTVKFLAPDSSWTASLHDPNLASTVASVRFGLVRFLLVGDAEVPEEAWLLEHEAGELRADVLKVGHHGSATSSDSAFLAAVRPRVALVSVGLGNSYHHPSHDVMARLARLGAAVLRTDELGTTIVRTDGRTITLEARGVEWTLSDDSPPR